MAVEDQVAQVFAATNGFLDRINADRVPEFHEGLVERLHADASDTLGKIAEGDWSDEIQDKLRGSIEQFAEDFGYDLDEEGQPLGEDSGHEDRRNGDRPEAREEEDGSEERSDEDSDDDPQGDSDEREAGAVAAGEG
jgi:F-type H+-transporting ATPase subunit alpha